MGRRNNTARIPHAFSGPVICVPLPGWAQRILKVALLWRQSEKKVEMPPPPAP